jgi:hypothetical protein
MAFMNKPQDQQEQEKYLAAADQPEVLAHGFDKPEDEIFASPKPEEQEGGDTEGHAFFGKPEDEEDGPEVEGHALTQAKPEDEARFKAH